MSKSEQASTLKFLHLGHYAIDKMSLRAREIVYWPGIIQTSDPPTTNATSAQNLQDLNKERHYSL